ncbi:GntR family transcriptional regulator [Paraburkholderia sediminicola]|uniref:GntR family transcriptional regulator n=1 Tax=Paraburkholderia sediminicola TaxID=458836 RepID=UPI0038B9CC17
MVQAKDAGRAPQERQSDQAFDVFSRAIKQCELVPGDIVSEPQLEQDYGFGRVPIRLAMDRLIQLKLVKPIHRKGFEIAPITLSDVKNSFQLRLMVEPPAVRLAVGRVDIAALRRAADDAGREVKAGDKAAEALIIEANRRLHMLIMNACGNEKVATLVGQILSDIDRVYYFGLVRNADVKIMQDDHGLMIDALESGDGVKAERLARKHIENGYSIVMDTIINSSNLSRTTVQALDGLSAPAVKRARVPAKSGVLDI